MSLRTRLTLLYTSLVGGVVLLLGVAVYGSVSVILTNQLDNLLSQTAEEIISNTSVDSVGQLNVITLPVMDLPSDVLVQVWGRESELRASSPNISFIKQPLDPVGVQSPVPLYRDVNFGNVTLRTLTVPLKLSDRQIGVLQVGTSMDVVSTTQETLLTILLVGTISAIFLAAFLGWFTIKRALNPLDHATQAALQITRADDLSRRIPYHGPEEDEVGQLINAFNLTLSRLERLFLTQRRFLADVGHELRTPLTVIKGNVGLMRRMKEVDEESLVSIDNEVDRLTRLVGDLLLLAQAESGKIQLARELVELDTLLLEAFNEMLVLTKGKLRIRLGDIDQVLVCGDRDKLKQVIVNLVGNAINYTPQGGEIIVGLCKDAGYAQLTVSDNGPGIPPEDLPHIFERFYRAEKSRTRSRDGKGFGLGLSIAYWIVRNHNGRIEVDSTVGKGTSFCVWLPLSTGNCEEK